MLLCVGVGHRSIDFTTAVQRPIGISGGEQGREYLKLHRMMVEAAMTGRQQTNHISIIYADLDMHRLHKWQGLIILRPINLYKCHVN